MRQIKEYVRNNKWLLDNIDEVNHTDLEMPHYILEDREKMYCIDIAYTVSEFNEEEAMSAAYIIAQKYPKVLLKALATRFGGEL